MGKLAKAYEGCQYYTYTQLSNEQIIKLSETIKQLQ